MVTKCTKSIHSWKFKVEGTILSAPRSPASIFNRADCIACERVVSALKVVLLFQATLFNAALHFSKISSFLRAIDLPFFLEYKKVRKWGSKIFQNFGESEMSKKFLECVSKTKKSDFSNQSQKSSLTSTRLQVSER